MNAAVDFFGGQPRVLNTEHKLIDLTTGRNLQREVDTVDHFDDDSGELNVQGLRAWFVAHGLIRGYRQIEFKHHVLWGEYGSIEVWVDGKATYAIIYLD